MSILAKTYRYNDKGLSAGNKELKKK